jgi:hypothetical protein
MGLLGILLAPGLLFWLAFRGWSNATSRTRDGDGVQARAGLNQRAERAQSD